MTRERNKVSTSALAKMLGKSSRQLFTELEALGWIKREEQRWSLTAKGEFEQGSYRESERYGRYIVWPDSVTEHRALVNPEDRLTGARGLGLKSGLAASRINQLLADLGWVRPWLKGWQLTDTGEAQGGVQKEDIHTSIPYVVWPKTLPDNTVFKRALREFGLHMAEVEQCHGCRAMDGHLLRSEAEVKIDNWLYLAQIIHACDKPLPVAEQARADFYLPQAGLFIEYWGSEKSPSYLADKMRKKALYEAHNLAVIELQEVDLDALDEVLPRQLRRFGLAC
ncbi:hypothetical protein SAMN03080615_00504 [Amphritea atlantica]|uniref:Glycerol kinase n=1 Tax=Amphritea atlantica TaxID=355243 RepID=A0A1H9DEB7_9GAMM|nr:hypothetical protein [Amphritea atlantica]SEQ11804.1 hypothetical protein SAMN03080615_00504 [Amphritea atlantica]